MFALLRYSFGTGDVDPNADYADRPALSPADYLPHRHSGSLAVCAGMLLLPAFLPMLLNILLVWLHPVGLPKRWVPLSLAADAWVFFSTPTCFAPKIQLPLDEGLSMTLIEALLRKNLPLRGSVIVAGAAWARSSYCSCSVLRPTCCRGEQPAPGGPAGKTGLPPHYWRCKRGRKVKAVYGEPKARGEQTGK